MSGRALNIERTQARVGYVAAARRPRCGNCAQLQEPRPGFFTCARHGFMVTAYAVCDAWQKKEASR